MKERCNDIDDRSRDAAQNIHIVFDNNAWDKMEAMLDEENRIPVVPVFSNTLTSVATDTKKRRWLTLLLIFFFTGASIYFFRKNNTLKSKSLPVATNENKAADKSINKNNQEYLTGNESEAEQLVNGYSLKQQSEKNDSSNKYFKSKATADKRITFPVIIKSVYKKEDLLTGNTVRHQGVKNNFSPGKRNESEGEIIINNTQSDADDINNGDLRKLEIQPLVINKKSVEKKEDGDLRGIKIPLSINIKDSVSTAAVNKKSSESLKNKFFKNIELSVFTSVESNTVNFNQIGKLTAGYGAGINYIIGKHFTVQAQFVSTKKVYVTNRKGYTPPAGSVLVPVDTLEVNADCKVLDIPVNIRYSFRGNNKNSFFINAGISSYIMKKEIYNFTYYEQGEYKTRQRIIKNENKHNFCNLNLSVGYRYWLNKKWSVGFEPYLKLPLNGIGAGKVKLTTAGALLSLTFKPL